MLYLPKARRRPASSPALSSLFSCTFFPSLFLASGTNHVYSTMPVTGLRYFRRKGTYFVQVVTICRTRFCCIRNNCIRGTLWWNDCLPCLREKYSSCLKGTIFSALFSSNYFPLLASESESGTKGNAGY